MIWSVRGKLVYFNRLENGLGLVAVECENGVGFELKTSYFTFEKCVNIGSEIRLYSYFSVKENAVDFFGFFNMEERECFKMLVSVSGVGPSSALLILSFLTPLQFVECIRLEDYKTLSKCKGIGQKTANRIILELKNRISSVLVGKDSYGNFGKQVGFEYEKIEEAVSALVALGYGKKEAVLAVSSQKEVEGKTVEDLIKGGFKFLAN